MNAPQKTIVVGVDGSQNAERGLRWAIEQAREANAQILAVYAISPPPYRAMGMYVSPAVGFDEEWLSQVKSVFQNEWCRPLKESGVPYRTFIGEGDPAAVIIRVADEQDADMIVLGRRGLGGFEALLLGSVSSKVAHHSHKPVLLISP